MGLVRRGAGGDVEGLKAAIEALADASPLQTNYPKGDLRYQNRYIIFGYFFIHSWLLVKVNNLS